MRTEFLNEAIAALEQASEALERWRFPSLPQGGAELQDTGEYLAAVGRAMGLVATAFDEALMAREKAQGLRSPGEKTITAMVPNFEQGEKHGCEKGEQEKNSSQGGEENASEDG